MAELIRPGHHPQPHFRRRQLMQNCDLPPPTKLYMGCFDEERAESCDLARALRLSERRVREAERRAEESRRERDAAMGALVAESIRAMAYRRWVMVLEVQIRKWKTGAAEGDGGGCGGGVDKWKVGLVICLGLAGLGFACRFGFI
uniref:Uncharacterized protein n=1 Tax=Kalanchoe fedtschenkoi TaxID=63787 RepID=A0A7N0VF07_KALFE